jgi:hypothetical protein
MSFFHIVGMVGTAQVQDGLYVPSLQTTLPQLQPATPPCHEQHPLLSVSNNLLESALQTVCWTLGAVAVDTESLLAAFPPAMASIEASTREVKILFIRAPLCNEIPIELSSFICFYKGVF